MSIATELTPKIVDDDKFELVTTTDTHIYYLDKQSLSFYKEAINDSVNQNLIYGCLRKFDNYNSESMKYRMVMRLYSHSDICHVYNLEDRTWAIIQSTFYSLDSGDTHTTIKLTPNYQSIESDQTAQIIYNHIVDYIEKNKKIILVKSKTPR